MLAIATVDFKKIDDRRRPLPDRTPPQYFPIAGAAEKVRLAFVLGDVPFEDETVYGEAWAALKPTTPYGQIPLLTIDGGAPITQSDAMLRCVD